MKTSNPTLIHEESWSDEPERLDFSLGSDLCGFFFRPKIRYHCKGQDTHHPPAYVTDAVVSKMQDDWDLKELQKGNEETLKGTGALFSRRQR